VRYGGPNRFDSWHFRTAPYEIRTNLSRNPPGTPRIRRHRPVAEEEGRKRGEGANPIIYPGRAQARKTTNKHRETWGGWMIRKALKVENLRSLPCLALPLEGVRLGAELHGRHPGRRASTSSRSAELIRGQERSGAPQTGKLTRNHRQPGRAEAVRPWPRSPSPSPLSETKRAARCNPALGQGQQPNPTPPGNHQCGQ